MKQHTLQKTIVVVFFPSILVFFLNHPPPNVELDTMFPPLPLKKEIEMN